MNPNVGDHVTGLPEHGALLLTDVLGAGAFGIVFRATSQTTGRDFAVKFLQSGLLADPHERLALTNEILAATQVSHANVISVLYAHEGSDSTQPYIVSDFAEGGTLHDRLTAARAADVQFPIEVVRRWSEELCGAMEAINAKVLHRDLKPDNILIVGDSLRIADFGLAKLVGDGTRLITFKGGQHIWYMAPEGWQGRQNTIQLDMYAAGLILYEIGTLRYPYQTPVDPANLEGFRMMHLTQVPKSPHLLRAELPRRFSEVVLKLMAKRPESRYGSWKEAVQDLRLTFSTDEGTSERENPLIRQLLETAHRRHRDDVAAKEEAAADQRRREKEAMIDQAQREEIVALVQKIVDAFNAGTGAEKASLLRLHGGESLELRFPYAGIGHFGFFAVHPPLHVDAMSVRFAARVSDDQGCGFNLLLQRREGEEFGVWVVCRTRINPIVDRRHLACRYLAMQASQVHDIERGHRSMATYVPEFSNDIEQALNEFVSSLFNRGGPFRHS